MAGGADRRAGVRRRAPPPARRPRPSTLDAWHADATSGAAVRVCFRLSHLHEPEPDEPDATGAPAGDRPADDAWLLEFLLQPLDEPSVLVPAADVWRDRSAPLRRWTHHPQERLLAGLGRAARLYPDLDAALRVARPVELVLDTEGAHRFLSQAPVLEQAGYGILLPAWWRRAAEPRAGAGGAHRATPIAPVLRDEAANLASHRGLPTGGWRSAGGCSPRTSSTDLARVKVPLVRLRGRWVYLDPDRLAAGLTFLRRGGGTMTAGDALRMIRLLPPEELPLPVTATERHAAGSPTCSTGDLDQRLELLDPPAGLAGVLRPYQRRGFSWLAFLDRLGLGACLADDMGLGKTVQLLALLLHARRRADAADLPAVGARQLAAGGGAVRARRWRCGCCTAPTGPIRTDLLDGCDVLLTTYATATRDADALAAVRLGPGGARRGAAHQEQRQRRGQGGAAVPGAAAGSR